MLASALDWENDYLIPGLVELHTDNLEKHMEPRPGVRWPALSALLIHDAQIASSGITTVLDALFIGDLREGSVRTDGLHTALDAIGRASDEGLLRAEHLLHLRCELSCDNMMESAEPLIAHPRVRLISVMDHTPGQRQWTQLDKFRQYMQGQDNWSQDHLKREVDRLKALQSANARRNRTAIVGSARSRNLPLASHDDTLPEHVEEAVADGMTISEFPTSELAARAARERGLATVLGSPNLVRGRSHSGNASALELAKLRLVDVLSSDYVPHSLLHAVFILRDRAGWSLPDAVRTVSHTPARLVGLNDRGQIALGQRGDFVRVREHDGVPVPFGTWRDGRRIA
jgi:alpha-D-ribose 1-methylphosphonate 5-triphosphate diphosphatase